jgi:hypothetical protein
VLGERVVGGIAMRMYFRSPVPHHLPNAVIGVGQDGKHQVFKRDHPDAHLDKLGVTGITGIPNASFVCRFFSVVVWHSNTPNFYHALRRGYPDGNEGTKAVTPTVTAVKEVRRQFPNARVIEACFRLRGCTGLALPQTARSADAYLTVERHLSVALLNCACDVYSPRADIRS